MTEEATGPAALATGSHGGRETILVVDDEETVRTAVRRILQKSGYRVIVAESGAEALELLAANGTQVALVLTDMVMPGIGGRQLIEMLTHSHPAVRIVGMSGYTDDETLRLGKLAGEHAFVAKPFTVGELTATIRGVLDTATAAADGADDEPLVLALSSAGAATG